MENFDHVDRSDFPSLTEEQIAVEMRRAEERKAEVQAVTDDLETQINDLLSASYHKGFEIQEFRGWDDRRDEEYTSYYITFDGKEVRFTSLYGTRSDKDGVEQWKTVLSYLIDESKKGEEFRTLVRDVLSRYEQKQADMPSIRELRDKQNAVSAQFIMAHYYGKELNDELKRREQVERAEAVKMMEQWATEQDKSPLELMKELFAKEQAASEKECDY